MPAIIKILLVFISVLALARMRVSLGVALIAGAVALNLWAGLPVNDACVNLCRAFLDAELWLFLAILIIILEIGRFMTEKRNAEEIISATRRWGGRHGKAASLMAVPAVIGLIPMPAGALFSAPFVEQSVSGMPTARPQEWKSAVNYWFRHLWEYWWPLYPGVIVAMSLFDMLEAWQFVSIQILFTPVSIAAGYFFLVRPHIGELSESREPGPGSNRRALFILLPLMIVIACVIFSPFLLKKLLPQMSDQIRKMLAVLIGLLAAMTVIIADVRKNSGQYEKKIFSELFTAKSMNVTFSLVGIMVFKFMLTKSGLLPLAAAELVRSGIPIIIVVALLPCLAGLVTGFAIGFTGTAFPLVVGLMTAQNSGLTPLATLVLAYGCGYMGMMLSPVHLCLLVTKDYFDSSLRKIYMQILPCIISIFVYSLAAHLLLRLLKW